MTDAVSPVEIEKLKGEIAARQAGENQKHDLELERQKAALAEIQAAEDHKRTTELEQGKAQHARDQAELVDELAAEAADAALDRELRKQFHTSISTVASGAIDRSRDSAKYVQIAAAAVITAYQALLALVFSVTGRSLPLRGLYPAVFLGFAIAMSVAYLAFLRQRPRVGAYQPAPSFAETQLGRTSNFVEWMNAAVDSGAGILRAGVIAFGFGVAFIPAAFIGPTSAAAPSAGAPAVPTIPDEIDDAVEAPARRLFEYQVNAYLEAVEAEGQDDASPTPPDSNECSGISAPLRSCGWRTEAAVERSFRWLALLGLAAVLLGAFLPRRRRTSRPVASNDVSVVRAVDRPQSPRG